MRRYAGSTGRTAQGEWVLLMIQEGSEGGGRTQTLESAFMESLLYAAIVST